MAGRRGSPTAPIPAARQPDRTVEMPLYRRLALELRENIVSGRLNPERFPTEAQLCRQHGTSRFTVREALRVLQTEGIIRRRRGAGTTVQPQTLTSGFRQRLSDVEDILRYARDTDIAFEAHGLGTMPTAVADEAGVSRAARWLRFSGLRRRRDGGEVIAFSTVYLDGRHAGALARLDPTEGLTFRHVEQAIGVRIARVTQELRGVMADSTISAALGFTRRALCLRILRAYADATGTIHQISISHHPGDRFTYAMHMDVGR